MVVEIRGERWSVSVLCAVIGGCGVSWRWLCQGQRSRGPVATADPRCSSHHFILTTNKLLTPLLTVHVYTIKKTAVLLCI